MTAPTRHSPRATASRAAPERVLFAHNSAEIGGGNRVLLGLLDRLPRDRFAPLSLVPGRGSLDRALERSGVPAIHLDTLTPLRHRSAAAQAATLLRLALALGRKRIALLHANGALSYRLPALALPRVPRLCHLHLPWPGEALLWAFRRRRPSLVLACSEAVRARALIDLGEDAGTPPVETVPNAVDVAHWSTPAGPPAHTLPEHDALVLFCGSLAERKGVEDYLRLAAAVLAVRPRSLFVVAGEDLVGGGEYRRRLERMARSSGLGERVCFTGFVEDPRPLVQAARMVVLPSSSEGMPMSLLEAAAAGRPVVAYRIPGVDEVVTDGVTGRLVGLGDVAALAAAVSELLAQPELAAEMGRRGYQQALEHHDLTPYAERMVELYDRVLGAAPGAWSERPQRGRARGGGEAVWGAADGVEAASSGRRGAAPVGAAGAPSAHWSDRYRDRREVERYFASRFTSPLGALFHRRQAAAVRAAAAAVGAPRVLEVAAGPARFARELFAEGARSVFLDASMPMLRAARTAASSAATGGSGWAACVAGDASRLPFPDAAFDLVLVFRFLRHLDAVERAACYAELARVLRPGGGLLFDAVNERVAEPLRLSAPHEYPLPDRLFTEAGLRRELSATAFTPVALEPVARRYGFQRRLQILLAPRSRALAGWAIGVADAGGRAPLEWVVRCRRA